MVPGNPSQGDTPMSLVSTASLCRGKQQTLAEDLRRNLPFFEILRLVPINQDSLKACPEFIEGMKLLNYSIISLIPIPHLFFFI